MDPNNPYVPKNKKAWEHLSATKDWNAILKCLRALGISTLGGTVKKKESFLAVIESSGPAAEEDYTDARYWVRRQTFTHNTGDTTAELTENYGDYGDSDYTYTATNLAELSANTHSLSTDGDELVQVWKLADTGRDDTEAPIWHYYFWRSPTITFCTNSDYSVESDLDALSSDILEISTTVSPGDVLSDLKDDITAVMVRGIMYTDSEGKQNPWFAATLPLCVDSDYSTISELGTLAAIDITAVTTDDEITTVYAKGKMYQDAASNLNPWFIVNLPFCTLYGYETVSEIDAASISDITGDIGGDADDNFYAKGHIYQDADSDLNPWIVVDLSPGPSKYLYDNSDSAISGCVIVTGLDLDSIGRVRRFRIYDYLATPEDVGWIGPEV